MMRSGHLLAEKSPHNLLTTYGLRSLEDVFLKLCVKEGSCRDTNLTTTIEHQLENVIDCGYDNQLMLRDIENPDAIDSNSNLGPLKQANSNIVQSVSKLLFT